MNPADILQTLILAVSGWTLHKIIRQGEEIASIKQKLKDLRCFNCEEK